MAENDLVILYSGGADSYLLLHFALKLGRKPFCVLVNYGQKHVEELEYAKKQLDSVNVPYQIVKIEGLDVPSGLTGDLIPGVYTEVHPMNVPGRNTLLISLAYSIAESKGIQEIWYGADYSDFVNAFPDCYQEYVGAMNEVLQVAPSYPIQLCAPLLGWTKEMVLQYIEKVLNVDLKTIYSGYEAPQ